MGYSDTVELLLKQGACANAITKVTNKLWFLKAFGQFLPQEQSVHVSEKMKLSPGQGILAIWC